MEALMPEPARPLLEKAYQIRLQQFGPEDQRALQFAMVLGWVYSHLEEHEVAIRMWTDQIETLRRAYGDVHWRIILLMTSIGGEYEFLGNYEKAEACLGEALKRWAQQRNPSPGRLVHIQRRRGWIYLAQGRYALAEQTLRQALELELPPGVERLSCMRMLSITYREQGRYEEAQQLCQTTLDAMREELGEDHWATLGAKCELGRILMARGQLPEAEKLISEALHSMRIRRSLAHQIFTFINPLAVVYTKQGKYEDANNLFTEALEGRRQIFGENHPETLETINDFGVLRREQKNYPEAEKLLRQALDGRQLKLGKNHPACFESMHELAVLYKEQSHYEDAEPLLIEAVEGRLLKLGDAHPHTIESLNNLIALYEAWNKPEKAEEWQAKLTQTEAKIE
jgi:tetratricopeptide (TPR) repeat protein